MAELEKVIKALELCTCELPLDNKVHLSDLCEKCPYHAEGQSYCFKKNNLMKDALELLKEYKEYYDMKAQDAMTHCKCCKFIDESVKTRFFCGRLMRCVDEDWFCADGEQRTD